MNIEELATIIYKQLWITYEAVPQQLQKNLLAAGLTINESSKKALEADFEVLAEAAVTGTDTNARFSGRSFSVLEVFAQSIAQATPEQLNKLNALAEIFGVNPETINPKLRQ